VDKIIELNGTLKQSDTQTSGTREHEGNQIHEIGNEGNEKRTRETLRLNKI
jgi:hypothetical protein